MSEDNNYRRSKLKHKEHRAITKLLLGDEFAEIHRWMDKPAYRYGPGHRKFRHDLRAVIFKWLQYNCDPRAGAAVLIHEACDFAPNEIKKLLKQVRK